MGGEPKALRVAVIGAGPAGFYAAAGLLGPPEGEFEVDLFDRLPTPYGLVRGGVAPDHQKIKSVVRVYEKIAQHPRFRFFGNVELGRDVHVADLTRHYDVVVYAVGNEVDRRLGIPGEDLVGCAPAGWFVGWYNAHPDRHDVMLDLRCERIAIVGNGNVAIDLARILAREPRELELSDMPDHAIEALRASRVREILVLGRRGPAQAAFTPLELKELTTLERAEVAVDPAELELDAASRAELDRSRDSSNARRNLALLAEAAHRAAAPRPPLRIVFRFLVSPVEILGDANGRVAGIVVEHNRLEPLAGGALRAVGTARRETIALGAVFIAVGYSGRPIPGVPFEARAGVVPNVEGRVIAPSSGAPARGQYVVGWARTGPRGLIGMHKSGSAEVVEHIRRDVAAGDFHRAPEPSRDAIVGLLETRRVRYVTYEDWQRIDAAEVDRGRQRGAPRLKFHRLEDLREAAGKGSDETEKEEDEEP